MTLEFLGTGTSSGIPMIGCTCAVCTSTDAHDKRLRASVVVRTKGRTLLIDAGPDLRQQALRAALNSLDAVLFTHSHMDHIAGIDELRSFNFVQQRALDIYGSTPTLAAIQRMFAYAFETEKYPGTPDLVLHTFGEEAFDVCDIQVTPIQVKHYLMPVQGFRIGGLAYITDAKSIAPAELDKVRGCEVLVLNALRKEPHISHFTLGEALAVVEEVKPARAYFTHISHMLGTHAAISKELPEHVTLAHDGLIVEVAGA